MRAINTIGNKIFQFLISLVIGQKLTDSLCGTKVFRKEDIDRIYRWQKRLKSKDPFGPVTSTLLPSIETFTSDGTEIGSFPILDMFPLLTRHNREFRHPYVDGEPLYHS